jgi:hypothetical protein
MASRHPLKKTRVQRSIEPTGDGKTVTAVIEHPDGYYWQAFDGRQEFGPHETYELALAARDAATEEAVAPMSDLRDVERESGIADWVDSETGDPFDDESPRLREEQP